MAVLPKSNPPAICNSCACWVVFPVVFQFETAPGVFETLVWCSPCAVRIIQKKISGQQPEKQYRLYKSWAGEY